MIEELGVGGDGYVVVDVVGGDNQNLSLIDHFRFA